MMLRFSAKLALFAFCLTAIGAAPVLADDLPEDTRSAAILAYFTVGNDDAPAANITVDQFAQQIEELSSGGYTVAALPDLVRDLGKKRKIPPRTVAITFDGADTSILTNAAPILIARNIPFTVFVPSTLVSSGNASIMSWNDLRTLKETGLASFGIHASDYAPLPGLSEMEIRRQVNNSLAAVRRELGVNATLFAYPQGEYDPAVQKILKSIGVKAAFGQQSGAAFSGNDLYALPRYTQTEQFADMERFLLSVEALPLPVADVSPPGTKLSSGKPAIGFTITDSLSGQLKNLACYASGTELAKLTPLREIIGNRVELRFRDPLPEGRLRVNCTLPGVAKDETPATRWFGMLFTVP